jgi:hypothetical protein
MTVSPLLAPGALSAYTGVPVGRGPTASPFEVNHEAKGADRVTISHEARRLSTMAVSGEKPKIPDDFELRMLTQKLMQGSQIRDFLTRAFQPNL